MKAAAVFRLTVIAPLAALAGCAMNIPIGKPFPQLPGTEWRVVAVNGRPTPATGDYMMRFEPNRRLAARFGCNSMGGNYRSVVGTLTVSDLAQTLMGCPEPAATFESQASAILQRQMKAELSAQGRLTLGNAVGTITLDRVR